MAARLVLPAMLALAAPAHATPEPAPAQITVTAPGTVVTSTVRGKDKDRYELRVADRGTLLVTVVAVCGPAPRGVLKTDDGHTIRHVDRHGRTWARPPAETVLVLEIKPRLADEPSTYQLTVAINVDRPRPERSKPRPARPRDIVRVPNVTGLDHLERVTVGGLATEYVVSGRDVLVTIPAFAAEGRIKLGFDNQPPVTWDVRLIGIEPVRDDVVTGACKGADGGAQPGCLKIRVTPVVGTAWLRAMAHAVDADIATHIVKTGEVELKLRLPSAESYTLETLHMMPGVLSAVSESGT